MVLDNINPSSGTRDHVQIVWDERLVAEVRQSAQVWFREDCGLEFWGDTVESIAITHPVSGEVAARKDETYLYPSKHFVMPEDRIKAAVGDDVRLSQRCF